ncbi:MAG: hypothetical protein J1F10_08135 [Muribaculaceae bacterium]|nr:hypothetical protein [Muribaculaceae bacterium]
MKKLLIFGFVVLSSYFSYAQNTDFERYAAKLNEKGVSLSLPKKAKSVDISSCRRLPINPDYAFGYFMPGIFFDWAYATAAESADAKALFLYPIVPDNTPIVRLGYVIESEIQASKDNDEYDISGDIKIISDNNMNKYGGADTAVIYTFPLSVPYLEKYNQCIGIYLRKYGHPALLLKVLTDDKGLEKKEKYIAQILSGVLYKNLQLPEYIDKENVTADNTDLQFPIKKDPGWAQGIIPTNQSLEYILYKDWGSYDYVSRKHLLNNFVNIDILKNVDSNLKRFQGVPYDKLQETISAFGKAKLLKSSELPEDYKLPLNTIIILNSHDVCYHSSNGAELIGKDFILINDYQYDKKLNRKNHDYYLIDMKNVDLIIEMSDNTLAQ